uniref:C-CAP/cofactor C-like domain-containing protein n=1 Tax=Amphiprion percula TaxID=161767 RepID=A0A3P8T122_AMPPE
MLAWLKDITVGHLPRQLHRQQFVIQECEKCNIYVFNHSKTITINDCVICHIFRRSVKGSVFVRDCKHTQCKVACLQFHTKAVKRQRCFCAAPLTAFSSTTLSWPTTSRTLGSAYSTTTGATPRLHVDVQKEQLEFVVRGFSSSGFLPTPDCESEFKWVLISCRFSRRVHENSEQSCLFVFFAGEYWITNTHKNRPECEEVLRTSLVPTDLSKREHVNCKMLMAVRYQNSSTDNTVLLYPCFKCCSMNWKTTRSTVLIITA